MRKNSLRSCLTVIVVSVKWDAMYIIVSKNYCNVSDSATHYCSEKDPEKDLSTCQEETASI